MGVGDTWHLGMPTCVSWEGLCSARLHIAGPSVYTSVSLACRQGLYSIHLSHTQSKQ